MDLFIQDFNTITFQDVLDFCDQKIVESTVLDYKQVIPRDLAKHFAAMSNRLGGLIIIGVEEDPQTGTPSRYKGIVNDGKLIDRIHQFANNVRPLPGYSVRTTNEVGGKVFLLIRISEGGAPPYTTVNDPTVYLRTGNITTPLRQADADIVRDLYAKRTSADTTRRDNVARAKAVLLSVLEQEDLKRKPPLMRQNTDDGGSRFFVEELSDDFRLLTAHLQPFYPRRELASPRAIHAMLDTVCVRNGCDQGRFFPSRQMKPIARGMIGFRWTGNDVSFISDQVYANGLFLHGENTGASRQEWVNDISLADIARVLYTTLLFGRKLYNQLGYSGLTRGAIELTGAGGRAVRLILLPRQYQTELPIAIDAAYTWPIAADTHQISDDAWVREYFFTRMREIYWDLGVMDVAQNVFDTFVKEWGFQ